MTELHRRLLLISFSVALTIQCSKAAMADENGVSFWLPAGKCVQNHPRQLMRRAIARQFPWLLALKRRLLP